MRVAITGSTGLIGRRLIGYFSECGAYQVLALGRKFEYFPELSGIEQQVSDLLIPGHTEEIITAFQPDWLINLAAVSSPDQCVENPVLCHALNVEWVSRVVKLAKRIDCRFLQVSTDFVFPGESLDYHERDPTRPVNAYGRTKEEAEILIMEQLPGSVIVRTVLVYGSNPYLPRLNLPLRVVQALSHGERFRVNNDQLRKPTYADDLARGLEAIVRLGLDGIFHLCGSEVLSVYELACLTAETFSLDRNLLVPVSSSELNERAARPRLSGLNISRAESLLGFRPTPCRKALEDIRHRIHQEGFPIFH